MYQGLISHGSHVVLCDNGIGCGILLTSVLFGRGTESNDLEGHKHVAESSGRYMGLTVA